MSLSFYVHIPYCVRRCGYCDFNTYTPSELKEGEAFFASSKDMQKFSESGQNSFADLGIDSNLYLFLILSISIYLL